MGHSFIVSPTELTSERRAVDRLTQAANSIDEVSCLVVGQREPKLTYSLKARSNHVLDAELPHSQGLVPTSEPVHPHHSDHSRRRGPRDLCR